MRNRATCRVCKKPTRYGIGRQGKVHCGDPYCAEQSRLMRNAAMQRSPRATCRICKKPTRYPADRQGKVNCGHPDCVKASREQWRANLRANSSWRRINRISREEKLLLPHLVAAGWTPQFKFVPSLLGAAHTYQLDFALPEKRLCVEVDGRAHRDRGEHDQRRDEVLAARGWRTMRVTAEAVLADLAGTAAAIISWANRAASVEIVPEPVKRCENPACNAVMIRPPGARLDRWAKKKTCSTACQAAMFSAKTTGKPHRGYGGVKFEHEHIPCRICQRPTARRGGPDHPLYNMMICGSERCRERSKEIKRENQRAAWARKRQES